MAANPLPHQPPQTPAPPQAPSHGILIALLLLALIIAGTGIAFFVGLRAISKSISVKEQHTAGGSNQMTVQTPAGDIKVRQGSPVDSTMLGLPVYPGARRVESHKSAQVRLDLPGHITVGVVTAAFETSDSIDSVKSYYEKALNGQVTSAVTKNYGETTVIKIKHHQQEKVVVLKRHPNGTRITLVRVLHGSGAVN